MIKGAIFDTSRKYRYSLWRIWDINKSKVTFIMLNGSTADEIKDDPTLKRCIAFAKSWGYGSLDVVNLFGYRTTIPGELKKVENPYGDENDSYILEAIKTAAIVIIAWGSHGSYKNQDKHVSKILKDNGIKPYCIDVSQNGHPRHPLYLKSSLKPKLYFADSF